MEATDIAAAARQESAMRPGRLDHLIAVLSLWYTGGLFLDGWAHNHLGSELETFFTPWHGVFYGGFLAVTLALLGHAWRHRKPGRPWWGALPRGYDLSLLGAGLFALGGLGDLVWHTLFGIEADVEALLSPTHLLLAVGMGLVVSGPLRAAWHREPRNPADLWPALLSATLTFSLITFMTQFAHPIAHPWAAYSTFLAHGPGEALFAQAMGVSDLLLQAGVMGAFALLLLVRWRLPFGALSLLLGLNALGMSFMDDEYRLVPAAAAAGLLGDLLVRRLRPGRDRVRALRLFAFALPAVYTLALFGALALTDYVWWSVHLWLGAVAMTGLAGWLLSLLAAPPASAPDD